MYLVEKPGVYQVCHVPWHLVNSISATLHLGHKGSISPCVQGVKTLPNPDSELRDAEIFLVLQLLVHAL